MSCSAVLLAAVVSLNGLWDFRLEKGKTLEDMTRLWKKA